MASDDFQKGTRVLYTTRDGASRMGTVRSVAGSFVDVKLDDMVERTFYIPEDMLKVLPAELDEKDQQ